MSIVMVMSTLGFGLFMLIAGFVAKKKWLKLVSMVPLALFLFQTIQFLIFLS